MTEKITIEIKDWASLQHYKDRNPIWVKLHRSLLNDYHWQRLPIASKALAPMLWLVASEHDKGIITDTVDAIAWRTGFDADVFSEALKPLIDKGFISLLSGCYQDASKMIEVSYQVAIPETERETKKEKKRIPPSVDGFDLFWNEYPRKVGRGLAVKAWSKAIAKTLPATIMDGLTQWKRSKDFPSEEKYIPHATTWLNAERWLDQILVDNSNSQRVTTEDERNHYMEESKKWLSEFRKNQSLTS
jgi:hypothetical protein